MHVLIMKGLIAILPIIIISSDCESVYGEPALQLFSRQPPDDSVSVTWKASRPTVPSMADEFGTHDNAYVCNYGGVWIAYREKNYFDGWLTPDVQCSPVWYAGNRVNSVWLLDSSKNLSIPTMNLFPGKGFNGVDGMLTTTEDQPRLSHFNSFIATGVSSVTFFQGYDYEFRPVCVKANAGSLVVNHSDLAHIGLGSAGVKSFRLGCFGTNIIHLNNKKQSLNIIEQVE